MGVYFRYIPIIYVCIYGYTIVKVLPTASAVNCIFIIRPGSYLRRYSYSLTIVNHFSTSPSNIPNLFLITSIDQSSINISPFQVYIRVVLVSQVYTARYYTWLSVGRFFVFCHPLDILHIYMDNVYEMCTETSNKTRYIENPTYDAVLCTYDAHIYLQLYCLFK